MEKFTHDKLDKLKIKFTRIKNLSDYQNWKYNTLKLLNSVDDKESMIEFLQYQKRRVEIKLKFIYRLYIDGIVVLLVTFLLGDFLDKLEEISKYAVIIIVIVFAITVIASTVATIYNERKLLFYKKCLKILQGTTE